MENLYQILQCEETVSYTELKKAYSELALKHHPDKTGENDKQSTEIFSRLSHAWKILSDPELRKEYDVRWKERCLAQAYPIQDTVEFEEFELVEESEDCSCADTNLLNIKDTQNKASTCDNVNKIGSASDDRDTECGNKHNKPSTCDKVNETRSALDDRDSESCDNKTERTCVWYFYTCRCGGQYVLTETDVQMKFDIVCCDSCTLTVQVLYGDDET